MKKLFLMLALAIAACLPAEAQGFGNSSRTISDSEARQYKQMFLSDLETAIRNKEIAKENRRDVIKQVMDANPELFKKEIRLMKRLKNGKTYQLGTPHMSISTNDGVWVDYKDLGMFKFCAIRIPKTTDIPNFSIVNLESSNTSYGFLKEPKKDTFIEPNNAYAGHDLYIREPNVFYDSDAKFTSYKDGFDNLRDYYYVIYKPTEVGDWITWQFKEDVKIVVGSESLKGCQFFVRNEYMKSMAQDVLPEEDKYKFLLEMWPVKKVEKNVLERAVFITYENGDSIRITKSKDSPYIPYWSGTIHLKGGNKLISGNANKATMVFPDGKRFTGQFLEADPYMSCINVLKNETLTTDGGDWVMADGTKKHEESRYEKQIREINENAEKERKKAEQQKQAERKALYTKYGQKYVDALMDDGEILVGCPFAFVKERCNVKLYRTDGQDQLYHLYSWMQDSGSNVIGQKAWKWTHSVWVRNGRVTSITIHY